jgi:uncharacterized protein YecT (DUF1311 family)
MLRFGWLVLIAVAAAMFVAGSASGVVGRAAKLSPPVIRESFTPLPCNGKPGSRTTLQQEGCAERQIRTTDGRINELERSIFNHLRDDSARRRLISAARAWLAYRRADCLSISDVFEGGSQAPASFAECAADRNRQRINDLRTFLTDLGGRTSTM